MNDSCPDIVDLERFSTQELDEPSQATVCDHLKLCSDCAALVAELGENLKVAAAIKRGSAFDTFAEEQPSTIGPYTILRRIGQGGMGSVYEAQQENPRRVVALKMIRPGVMSASLLARFRQESQVLGRLRHPGIAQVYEAGTHQAGHGPQPYFVMERVHGPPLLKFADERRLLTTQRLELLATVCDAVHHAHQHGVIHRDLKPDNILVDDSSPHGQPKILDFGVARVIDPNIQQTTLHTSAGQIVGTVAYMSPEQASGEVGEIDIRSDVYALGVIAFQLLSGRLPHKVSMASIAESVRTIVHDEPTTLESIDRSMRGDVTTIVGKALSKEKSRRYQSAAEMAVDIRRHLKDEPITAHLPSTVYQLSKFARRNKGLVAGVATAFLVLVAGVIGTSIGLIRAQRSRDLAVQARREADTSAAAARMEADRQVAVSGFLQTLLGAANPWLLSATERAKGRDISVVDALNSAAKKVDDGALKDSPEVEIAVRRIIGVTFNEIGEFGPSQHHLEAGLKLAVARNGEVNQDVADCANSLSKLFRDLGDLKQAEQYARRALDVAIKVFGPDNREVATCMNSLGGTLLDMGRYAEAEPVLREGLALRRRLLGDESVDVATSMNNLAMAVADRGKTEEAESLYRAALQIRYKFLGSEHPDIAVVLNNLGFVLRTQGKLPEAEQMFRDALAMRTKFFGEDHQMVATGLSNLGSVLQAQGKLDEAEPFYRKAIDVQKRASSALTPGLASMINNYATLLRERKMYAESLPLFRESLAIRKQVLPEGHPALGVGMANLASVLRELNQHEEAQMLARAAVDISVAKFGAESSEAASHRMNLGLCLHMAGNDAEAEKELLAGHGVAVARRDKSPGGFVSATKQLIRFYKDTGRADEAARFTALLPATQPAATQNGAVAVPARTP